jgi:hypothetical protein
MRSRLPALLGAAALGLVAMAARADGLAVCAEAGRRLFLDFGRRYMEEFTIVVPRGLFLVE